ncbi:MAG: hypothetical protein IJP70_05425 [Bacteroidales bacterium]|nr:hypothetical protein [Bacteroidales bacterium]
MLRLRNWFVNCLPLWAGVALVLASCDKANYESPVPAGYVSYHCTLEIAGLDVQGNYCILSDRRNISGTDGYGTGGLLLVHSRMEYGKFYAFDLACPYCWKTTGNHGYQTMSRIEIDEEDFYVAVCPTCQSKFGLVMDGSPAPTAGPANESNYILRQYKAANYGDQLVVTK